MSGLPGIQYEQIVELSKRLAVRIIPQVFGNFGGLCAPYLMETTDQLVNFSREFCMQKCDMDIYFEILNVSAYLASNFGIYATISSMPQVAFQDTDLNVGSLASLLVRLIV